MAPSAYLSSTAASADLVSALLPESDLFPFSEAALARWSEGHSDAPPTGAGAKIQKNWDGIVTQNLASTLLQGASDDLERTRLLAAMDKDSGASLQALPLTSVGLWMDDSTLRIAVGLRLGTPICTPHINFASIVVLCCQGALMGSAVGQVRVVTPGMRQSTTSSTAHSPRLVYHLGWSPLAYQDRMARGQMGLH